MGHDFTPEEMKGMLFDRKPENRHQNQPDYTGQVCIKGEVFRVAMWHRPPTERVKVSTYSVKVETEAEYQDRLQRARARSQRREVASRRPRGIGYSETKYPRR